MVRKERKPRPVYDRYIFTCFDPDGASAEKLDGIKGIRFMIRGLEIAPSTGRKHWQGYLELYDKVRPRALMRQLSGFHIEPARETRVANINYCMKDGNFTIFTARTERIPSVVPVLAPPLPDKEGGGKGGDGSTSESSSESPSILHSTIDHASRDYFEELKGVLYCS